MLSAVASVLYFIDVDPIASARRAAVLFLMGTGMACALSTIQSVAQSALPPTSPTVLPAAAPVTPPPAISTPVRVGVPAKVKYADGKLEVTADNSSLNQILREIGRLTGMTITGGVVEQRVYGNYGPAAPAEVLGDLLQGTGSNMLLRETSSAAPAELILSPRVGDVTPPNPSAAGFDGDTASDDTAAPQPPDQPVHILHSADPMPVRPSYVPPASTPTTSPEQPAPVATPASSSGPSTPEQIYQQLQQLQKSAAALVTSRHGQPTI